MSIGQYFSDGDTRVSATELPGGYQKVTFSKEGLADVTCESCPCFDACLSHKQCVKGTDFVTERL